MCSSVATLPCPVEGLAVLNVGPVHDAPAEGFETGRARPPHQSRRPVIEQLSENFTVACQTVHCLASPDSFHPPYKPTTFLVGASPPSSCYAPSSSVGKLSGMLPTRTLLLEVSISCDLARRMPLSSSRLAEGSVCSLGRRCGLRRGSSPQPCSSAYRGQHRQQRHRHSSLGIHLSA
jgi:hypothetical protein